jgi:hypothetical protein
MGLVVLASFGVAVDAGIVGEVEVELADSLSQLVSK